MPTKLQIAPPPKILKDKLTLSKPGGGANYAHQITNRPPPPRIFRHSYGPEGERVLLSKEGGKYRDPM